MEVWKEIPSCPGYEASSLGRIRSYTWTRKRFQKELADTARIKSIYVNDNGYCILSVGRGKKCRVHVLVAEAFIGPKPDGLDVNHIDGVKTNNVPENLEYMTRSENCKHGFRLGLSYTPFRERGENHATSILKDADVIAMRKQFAEGTSRRDLATQYGVSYYTVWDITKRRSWTHI